MRCSSAVNAEYMKKKDIVFEGNDNTGKSTLISQLHQILSDRKVIPSSGPEKYPGEIDERIMKLIQTEEGVIYDRHPAVSESMYCFLRNAAGPARSSIDLFYRTNPVIIYCRPPTGRDPMEGHSFNPAVDTPEHVKGVLDNYHRLTDAYDHWALQHAHFIYRIGDDADQLINAIVRTVQ